MALGRAPAIMGPRNGERKRPCFTLKPPISTGTIAPTSPLGKSTGGCNAFARKLALWLNAAPGAAPVDSWIWEHRAAIDFAARAIMATAGLLAGWSLYRDLRAAWPRIIALLEERNDDDDT